MAAVIPGCLSLQRARHQPIYSLHYLLPTNPVERSSCKLDPPVYATPPPVEEHVDATSAPDQPIGKSCLAQPIVSTVPEKPVPPNLSEVNAFLKNASARYAILSKPLSPSNVGSVT
jgi:hypothetical protein